MYKNEKSTPPAYKGIDDALEFLLNLKNKKHNEALEEQRALAEAALNYRLQQASIRINQQNNII